MLPRQPLPVGRQRRRLAAKLRDHLFNESIVASARINISSHGQVIGGAAFGAEALHGHAMIGRQEFQKVLADVGVAARSALHVNAVKRFHVGSRGDTPRCEERWAAGRC